MRSFRAKPVTPSAPVELSGFRPGKRSTKVSAGLEPAELVF